MTSINKALKILDLYLHHRKPIGISEASKSVGISPTTTHRIVKTLVKNGYLEQLSSKGKYWINKEKILDISNIILPNLNIRNLAWPFLQELSIKVRECSEIAIRMGNVAYKDDYLYTEYKSVQSLIISGAGEKIIDLFCTATGKVLLANMSDLELREYFNNVTFTQNTKNTITNPDILKNHLKTIRDKGVSFDNEELEVGIVSVAVPIMDPDGAVNASIGIVTPTARGDIKKLKEFSVVLKETALKISNVLKMGNYL